MIKLRPKANWLKMDGNLGVPGATWYRWGDLSVCVGDPQIEGFHHLSISHPYRYPTWEEIYTARYDLLPGEITCAIFLPKKSEYVNIHPNCFHVYQVKDEEL